MLKIRFKMVYEFSQKIPITIAQDNVDKNINWSCAYERDSWQKENPVFSNAQKNVSMSQCNGQKTIDEKFLPLKGQQNLRTYILLSRYNWNWAHLFHS